PAGQSAVLVQRPGAGGNGIQRPQPGNRCQKEDETFRRRQADECRIHSSRGRGAGRDIGIRKTVIPFFRESLRSTVPGDNKYWCGQIRGGTLNLKLPGELTDITFRPAGMGASSRRVSRLGYAAVIAILVFSSLQAYRIQGIASEQHVDIYRQYVKQDEAIFHLRRSIWLAGNTVRDFFLSSKPDRSADFQSQIHDLMAESHQALVQLEQVNSAEGATRLFKAN